MRASQFITVVTASTAAASFCPFLGPVFPPPKSLSSTTTSTSTPIFDALQSTIESAFISGTTSHGPVNPNDTYSIQVFSTTSSLPLLDFHHRGTELQGNGTLNGDSIYRIASVTKVWTVYLLLLQAGDGIFNEPVVKYEPGLKGKGEWNDITVGALAGYMAGIVGDLYDMDLLTGGGLLAAFPDAFPPLTDDERSPCTLVQSGCTKEVFLQHLATREQVFLPNTTPAYSNTGFALLGLILESVTGLSFQDSLRKLLATPLGLNSTSVSAPSTSERGVIVTSESAVGWDTIIDGAGIGMGAGFSSVNDMSAIGRAILSSSLLPSNTTRGWLKPVSHTSSLIGAVGRPWEIFRGMLGPAENNRVIDMYTKGGNFGGYGANFVLLPEYDVGFVVLQAGRRGVVPLEMSGLIVDQLLPALEEAARVEADAAYAGTYSAANGLNSTLTLSTTTGVPGLTLEQWTSNGTDLRRDVFGSPQHFQLFPTNVQSEDSNKASWRASYISINDVGPFSACPAWFALDRPTYGIHGLDHFVFQLDEGGKANAVEIPALKIVLERR